MVRYLLYFFIIFLTACKQNSAWNDPHQTDAKDNIRYASFIIPPKTLDPAVSYSVEETMFIAQIYEPVLQYHYLKRPYELIPLTAADMPKVAYLNKQLQPLPDNAPTDQVAFTRYQISLKPHILYQPHPAFAQGGQGHYLYHHLTAADLKPIYKLSDFAQTGTRELTADDYVYEIKRLASPTVNSPIAGLMSQHIVGFKEFMTQLQQQRNQFKNGYFDLRTVPMSGVKATDRYHFEILINGKYPQFIYWLAMPFFSPIPWEVDQFYAQPGMAKKNLSFSWYPVGTGPYWLQENNPNKEMILERNPNFHGEKYPADGEPGDAAKGLLAKANQPLPLIDKYVFTLEKESIPRWSKFLQGYYDVSAVGSDSFDQAIRIDANGNPQLTPEMQAKHIYLQTSVEPNIYYYGFNMLDDVVGGDSERARKLRQAISIALNTEEFITIFLNGRGIPAQGPIPPGIFGYENGQAGMNPYIYNWQQNHIERKSLAEAKKLMAEAGYPNGRDSKTGKQLILNYDATISSSAEQKSQMDWMRQQFAKLGIQLNIRATQANRFMEKLRTGNTQIFFFGWIPDYPDPENFLFLFYSPQGQVKFEGSNYSNYSNKEYDRLFLAMSVMPNGPERAKIIHQMIQILQKDSPWIWGFYPKSLLLSQAWVGPANLDTIGNNNLKYQWIDPAMRVKLQKQWNQPELWPLIILVAGLLLIFIFLYLSYRRKLYQPRIRRDK